MHHAQNHKYVQDDYFVREIKAGGSRADRAITSLYLKYRKRTYASLCRLISKNREFKGAAEDLLHDSFITLIQKIQYGPPDFYSLQGFWIGIGKNIFLNQLKKDSRILLVQEEDEKYGLEEMTPESMLLSREEEEQMILTFSQLGARCREILLLWIDQYSMVEIARKMNLSTDAMARKIKFTCFKKLKELVRIGNKMPG
jgi:RNA polymerase sigma factor (sigma-70 family)